MSEPKKIIAVTVFIVTTILCIGQLTLSLQFKKEKLQTPPKLIRETSTVAINENSPLFAEPLFGDYLLKEASEIKQSTLDVTVVGILYSPKQKNAQALIRTVDGKEKIYSVGDKLPGGAMIRRINKESILVFYEGELESLSLPKNDLTFQPPPEPLLKGE